MAGVDGCRGGWLVVAVPLHRCGPDQASGRTEVAGDFANATVAVCSTFEQIASDPRRFVRIAVDIPIGLPEQIGPGGRRCDVAARAVLGERQSAVFSMPSRRAVMSETYAAACNAALETSKPPRKISKQAFHLFPKVREVDAVLRGDPNAAERIVECHPEVAFWALNGKTPLRLAKKVKSRPNLEGLAYRRGLLASVGYREPFLEQRTAPARIAGPDDFIDACVNAWSAVRLVNGDAVCFPDTPDQDAYGLPIRICG